MDIMDVFFFFWGISFAPRTLNQRWNDVVSMLYTRWAANTHRSDYRLHTKYSET